MEESDKKTIFESTPFLGHKVSYEDKKRYEEETKDNLKYERKRRFNVKTVKTQK